LGSQSNIEKGGEGSECGADGVVQDPAGAAKKSEFNLGDRGGRPGGGSQENKGEEEEERKYSWLGDDIQPGIPEKNLGSGTLEKDREKNFRIHKVQPKQ